MIWLFWLGCADEVACDFGEDDTLGTLTAWEEDFVASDRQDLNPDPAFLEMEDGLPLAYRDWVPADWDGTGRMLVFVPGSSAHSALYDVLGHGLSEGGVYTRILDVRGHGLSVCAQAGCESDPADVDRSPEDDGAYWVGRVGDSLDDDQIVRDVGHALADLQETFPQASLALGGHSSGGGVVSRYVASTGAPFVDKVVLVAPYNHPDQPQVRDEVKLDCADWAGTGYARLSLGALGDALRGNLHRFVLRLHKTEAMTTPLDTLAYSYTTMTGMAASDPVAFWGTYTQPVLLLAGSEDHLLDPALSAEQVALAADGTFVEVAETSHIGLIWSDEVVAEIDDWL